MPSKRPIGRGAKLIFAPPPPGRTLDKKVVWRNFHAGVAKTRDGHEGGGAKLGFTPPPQ